MTYQQKIYRWITNIALMVVTSLLFNGGVFAENKAVINQSGGGFTSVKQSGSHDTGTIVQGKNSAASKKVRKHLRQGNRAVIQQEGGHNIARQTDAGHMHTVIEVGDGKSVTVSQSGNNE